MVAGGPRKQLALGANILLDLADRGDFARVFCDFFRGAGYALMMPPTVLFEMVFAAEREPEPQRGLARRSLIEMLPLGIGPFLLTPAEEAAARDLAQAVRHRGLLPAIELNDSLILAETALARIPLLVTSDYHLVDIDLDALAITFGEIGLPPVHPIHPNRLLRLIQ